MFFFSFLFFVLVAKESFYRSRVTITSIVRLVLLVQGLFGVTITSDTTNIGFVTSAIETNLALITASAPALRPIFRSRARGGWFPRTLVDGQSRIAADPEMGEQKKPVDWDTRSRPGTSSGEDGTRRTGGLRSKFSRGGGSGSGTRGGTLRRGSSSSSRNRSTGRSGRGGSRGGRGGGKIKPANIIRVKTDRDAAELRSQSPRSSEEETMTNNGIMRVSDIQREIDGIAREIGQSRPYTRRADSFVGPRPLTSGSITTSRPGTSGNGNGNGSVGMGTRPRYPPERFYSESIYPDSPPLNNNNTSDGNDKDERISRYGERRFGVVTPKGTTPTSRTWSGRPF